MAADRNCLKEDGDQHEDTFRVENRTLVAA
jgi:hypothetical protein